MRGNNYSGARWAFSTRPRRPSQPERGPGQVHFAITNATDMRRCGECRAFVRWRDLDDHAAGHGGIVGHVEQGVRV